jgi:hypothetical protein
MAEKQKSKGNVFSRVFRHNDPKKELDKEMASYTLEEQVVIREKEKVEYEAYMMKSYKQIQIGVWGITAVNAAMATVYAFTHNLANEMIVNFPSYTFPSMVAATAACAIAAACLVPQLKKEIKIEVGKIGQEIQDLKAKIADKRQ